MRKRIPLIQLVALFPTVVYLNPLFLNLFIITINSVSSSVLLSEPNPPSSSSSSEEYLGCDLNSDYMSSLIQTSLHSLFQQSLPDSDQRLSGGDARTLQGYRGDLRRVLELQNKEYALQYIRDLAASTDTCFFEGFITSGGRTSTAGDNLCDSEELGYIAENYLFPVEMMMATTTMGMNEEEGEEEEEEEGEGQEEKGRLISGLGDDDDDEGIVIQFNPENAAVDLDSIIVSNHHTDASSSGVKSSPPHHLNPHHKQHVETLNELGVDLSQVLDSLLAVPPPLRKDENQGAIQDHRYVDTSEGYAQERAGGVRNRVQMEREQLHGMLHKGRDEETSEGRRRRRMKRSGEEEEENKEDFNVLHLDSEHLPW
eukprot:Nk52_evm1s2489 gene=Nk52_evmTU1s2489